MAPPAPSASGRLILLRRFLSTATEAAAETAAPTATAAAPAAPTTAAAAAANAEATEAAAETPAPTAAAAAVNAGKEGSVPLYRRLSALGSAGEGSVSRVLNKWVQDSGEPRVRDLVNYAKKLSRKKRETLALELMDWMVFARGMELSHSNHALRLDLIYKVRGLEAAENYFSGLPDPAKNHQTYGALLNCYCSTKMENKATDLHHKMDKLGVCSTAAKAGKEGLWSLSCCLSALGSAGEGSVSRVLNKWVQDGGAPRVDHLIKHVKELRRNKRHAHALELMDWMVVARGMNMSPSNHALRLDLIYRVRGLESAENYFAGLPDPAKNHQTYGSLLNCYCSAKMEKKATDLHHKMDKLGACSNKLSFNNLMNLYLKLGQHEKVDSLFEEMKVRNIKPDSVTCCILMTNYASSNKMDAIEELLKEMVEKDVALGWDAYSTLASIYVNAGLVEKAEPVLKKLEGLVGADDGKLHFHFLMRLYASVGNLSEVNRVWDVMKTKFSKVTNNSYFVMLQALYRLNDTDRMKQIYVDWESNCKSYDDARLTNMMIRCQLKLSMTGEAESFWEKVKEKGAELDPETCELFIDHYMGNGDMNLALNWVENMTKLPKKARKLNQDKIHKFQEYFEKHKDTDGAERFCICLRTLGCIDGKAYESLLRTYFAAGKKIRSLRQQIKGDKIVICYDIKEVLKRMGNKGR